ncbi:MAG: dihydropteroate synthase [Archangium sp.]|nr:dihydropteroate synthase [Archangium sp.]
MNPLRLGSAVFEWGRRTFVMGVVNVTPDSFSDGGRSLDPRAAVEHGKRLVDDGADLLDVGGESTRPGAEPVSVDEECARVLPVLEGLARACPGVPLSIDTSKPEVARRALEAGAALVNDVTALSAPAMREVVASAGAAACLMHMQGTPLTMQQAPSYDDVVVEVREALRGAIARSGVPPERLLVDPGIGFGKSLEHNLSLLKHLGALRQLGVPILLGTSRKGFLGKLTGHAAPGDRVLASAVSVAIAAALHGVDMVRVHDVAETREALSVAQAIRGAR